MGEFIRPGTHIRDFLPDDTDTKMYKDGSSWSTPLNELMDAIKEKWPNAEPADIQIGAEHIHTHALGPGRYDPSDHTTFIVLEYKPVPEEEKKYRQQQKESEN